MVTTNVKIITNVSDISILVHDEYQNPFCEVHYEFLLQRLIITITSFAPIMIEAVIILCAILLIFLKYRVYYKYSGMLFEKQQFASNMLCSLVLSAFKRDRENRNRIIRITGLTFSKNIRHVDDPVGHQRRMRACSSQKYLTRNDTSINAAMFGHD